MAHAKGHVDKKKPPARPPSKPAPSAREQAAAAAAAAQAVTDQNIASQAVQAGSYGGQGGQGQLAAADMADAAAADYQGAVPQAYMDQFAPHLAAYGVEMPGMGGMGPELGGLGGPGSAAAAGELGVGAEPWRRLGYEDLIQQISDQEAELEGMKEAASVMASQQLPSSEG